MKVRTSVAGILFPQARAGLGEMERTLAFLSGRVDQIEFYYEGEDDPALGRLLERSGLTGVFIAVIPLKERGLSLCSLEEANRRAAVGLVRECIDRARVLGAGAVMVCSGKRPAAEGDVPACLDRFVASMEEIARYEGDTGGGLRLLLEPCDSNMDARHLIGPYARAKAFVETMRARGFPLELTMDSAHTVEEGEDFLQAVTATTAWCSHIHFANCRIANPADPLYGDKHLGFEYPDSVWSPAALADLFAGLERLYPADAELRIALEVLCREDDPYAYFERMWASLPFLSEYAS